MSALIFFAIQSLGKISAVNLRQLEKSFSDTVYAILFSFLFAYTFNTHTRFFLAFPPALHHSTTFLMGMLFLCPYQKFHNTHILSFLVLWVAPISRINTHFSIYGRVFIPYSWVCSNRHDTFCSIKKKKMSLLLISFHGSPYYLHYVTLWPVTGVWGVPPVPVPWSPKTPSKETKNHFWIAFKPSKKYTSSLNQW